MEARVITLGCRLNAFESQVLSRHARGLGLEDAIIVNTCAVTTEATRQARQAIRRARREHPRARIVVTGCAAQVDTEMFAAMPEVDRVLGNAEKLDPAALRAAVQGEPAPRVAVADIMAPGANARQLMEAPAIHHFVGRSRAFVQVQQGCDHRCTFCIIPFARGPSRSLPEDAVVARVRELASGGHAEAVLTGVDISSWGVDLEGRPALGRLVRTVLARVPALKRLRLGSLDPGRIDDELFHSLADEPRLMPHLHLSAQAGDDMVLKRMRRRHDRAGLDAWCARALRARPDVAFGADLIAGFPTETEAMFARTLGLVDEIGFTYLHVFPYSPRPGTPAARMPEVPLPERRARARLLREAGRAALARFLAGRVGGDEEILVEAGRRGRTAHYAPVRLGFAVEPGAIVRARAVAAVDGWLHARMTS